MSASILDMSNSHHVSRRLTTLVPQAIHKPTQSTHSPWSEGSDRIFRNEGVTVQIPSAPLHGLHRTSQGLQGDVGLFVLLPGLTSVFRL